MLHAFGPNDIGMLIRAVRESRNMSQELLAEKAGTSQTTIDKIERGLTKNSRFLPAITGVLEIDLSAVDVQGILMSGIWGQKSASNRTINDEIPLHPTVTDQNGLLSIDWNSASPISKLKFRGSDFGSFALYVSFQHMMPMFESGDVIVVDTRLPLVNSAPCIFFQNGNEHSVVRTLDSYSPSEWYTSWLLPANSSETLKREDWPTAHRVIARYLRM